MALKYKDLEAMAARQSEVWAPDGTPNLYAFARSSGHITWVVRIVIVGKRTNITVGNWPAVKAEAARAVAATEGGAPMCNAKRQHATVRHTISRLSNPDSPGRSASHAL